MAKGGFYCLFSFPPALNMPELWSDSIDGYRIGDLSHNDMFRKAKRSKQTQFNFNSLDLETNSKRVLTIAHPLLVQRPGRRDIFWGVLFWEIDLVSTLDQTIIPPTFYEFKYPFLRILQPISPYAGDVGPVLVEKIQDDYMANIDKNEKFKKWKKAMNDKLFT